MLRLHLLILRAAVFIRRARSTQMQCVSSTRTPLHSSIPWPLGVLNRLTGGSSLSAEQRNCAWLQLPPCRNAFKLPGEVSGELSACYTTHSQGWIAQRSPCLPTSLQQDTERANVTVGLTASLQLGCPNSSERGAGILRKRDHTGRR